MAAKFRLALASLALVLTCSLTRAKVVHGHGERLSRGLEPAIKPRSVKRYINSDGLPEATSELVRELFGRRKVYAIRYNYYRECSDHIYQYRQCAERAGIRLKPHWHGLGCGGRPVKVLFVGNSYMLQIKQALVLGIRDSIIKREFYLLPDPSHCRSCPCLLHRNKRGDLESTCRPVDVRAAMLPSGMVCDSRLPGGENTTYRDTPVWCIDNVSRVDLADGSVIATVKNTPYMNYPEGVRDALNSLHLRMREFDVVIANEGNTPTFIQDKCNTCTGSFATLPEFTAFTNDLRHALKRYKHRERIVRPSEFVESLHQHGFNGTLLYIHNEPWEDIPEDVHDRWRHAVKTVRPSFRVEPFEVMSPTGSPAIEACGNVRCHGQHHVMPGPPTIRAGMVRQQLARLMGGT